MSVTGISLLVGGVVGCVMTNAYVDTYGVDAYGGDPWGIAVGGQVMGMLYVLPAIVADMRRHRQAVAIWALNVFGGWTVVGWVAALVWGLVVQERKFEQKETKGTKGNGGNEEEGNGTGWRDWEERRKRWGGPATVPEGWEEREK